MCEPGCLQPGESLTLTAFADYYGGAPATETIVMPIITDDIQGANAVQAGQVDWKYSLTADAYDALKDDPNVQFAEYPDFGYFGLQYNLREGRLFADLGARKAVQYCIDKAATVDQATNGQGIPIEADIPPASWAYNPDLQPVERDVAAAIGFLEEAGWTVETDADGNATGPATRDGDDVRDRCLRACRPTGPHRVHGTAARPGGRLRNQHQRHRRRLRDGAAAAADLPAHSAERDRAVRRVLRWMGDELRPRSVQPLPLEPVHDGRAAGALQLHLLPERGGRSS